MKDAGKKHLIISLTAVFIVIFDQLTKYLISKTMELNQTIPIIKNIFHLTYLHNFGAGFSIFQGQRSLFILIALLVIGIIIYYYSKLPKKTPFYISIALILAGTIGNLIDRLFLGYVIDFLDFRIWPAFNIADSALTIGAIILIILYWKK